jgi:hypothetical protein
MSLAFMTLSGIEEAVAVHEAATDLVCTLLVRLEDAVGQGKQIKCSEMIFTMLKNY